LVVWVSFNSFPDPVQDWERGEARVHKSMALDRSLMFQFAQIMTSWAAGE